MGLYDNVLAQERENVALEAANMAEGRGSVYLAAKGGERMRQGARSMFGIEEPAVIAAKAQKSKQAQLQGIMSKYATASTREQFTAAFSELMANGFPEQAAKVQEHLKNMPKPEAIPDNIQLWERYRKEGGTDDLQTFLQSIKGKGVTINTGDEGPSVGWEAVDKAYATDYISWNQDKGDMVGQVAQLETVLIKLESGEDLTGVTIGLMPDWYNYLANPGSIAAKERVAEVVQRNLKLILGGQFSEREGEQLIARAYNPALDEKENISRLKRLIMQMKVGINARVAMNDHFNKFGTMKGYEGERVSIQSFYDAMEEIQIGGILGEFTYIGGDRGLPSSWKLTEEG